MSKILVERLSEEEVKKRGIKSWPIWEKEVSRFPWIYSGNEECLIIEGDFIVETKDGDYKIKPGDFVSFPDGLSCVWDIKKPVKKYYKFH